MRDGSKVHEIFFLNIIQPIPQKQKFIINGVTIYQEQSPLLPL